MLERGLELPGTSDYVQHINPRPASLLGIEPRQQSAVCLASDHSQGGRIVVVLYHNLTTTLGSTTRYLDVSTDPDLFRRHMRHFAQHYDIVGPDVLTSSKRPKRPLLITFDDNYRSVLEHGVPILREFAAPALWFMNSHSIEHRQMPLDNLLSWSVDRLGWKAVLALIGAPEATRRSLPDIIWNHVSMMSSSQVNDLRQNLLNRFEQDPGYECDLISSLVSADDLASLSRHNITVGNHSASHRFLRSLAHDELTQEISRGRDALERLSGQKVEHLAIPYGTATDATKTTLSVARSSGHTAIFLVHARDNRYRPASDIYYRVDAGPISGSMIGLSLSVKPRLRSAWHNLRSRTTAPFKATSRTE